MNFHLELEDMLLSKTVMITHAFTRSDSRTVRLAMMNVRVVVKAPEIINLIFQYMLHVQMYKAKTLNVVFPIQSTLIVI